MVEENKSSPQNDPEEKLGGGDQGITFDDLMNEFYETREDPDVRVRQQSCYIADLPKDEIPDFIKSGA